MSVSVDLRGTETFFGNVTSFSGTPGSVSASATALASFIGFAENATPPASLVVKWAAQTLSAITSADTGDIGGAAVVAIRAVNHGIANPTSGSQTFSATWTNSASGSCTIESYLGSDTTTPFKNGTTSNDQTGTSTAPSINVNSPSGDWCAGICAIDNNNGHTLTITVGQNQIYKESTNTNGAQYANDVTGAGASTSLSATINNGSIWAYAAFDVAAAAGAAVVETDTYSPPPRTFQQQWNPNKALYRTTAQDLSSPGVETNPHWRGRTWLTPWNIKRDWAPPQDASSFGVETNPHWPGRVYPIVWTPMPLARTTAQDFSSFGVETNPHWIGRTWPVQWGPLRTLMQNSDTNAPAQAVQPETNTFFVPRPFPTQWRVQPSLMRGAAQDFSSSAPETNIHYIPRTWPFKWNVQQSLMRGTAQDFSSTQPTFIEIYENMFFSALGRMGVTGRNP